MAGSGLAHLLRPVGFNRVALRGLFVLLCAFTLTTCDGGEIQTRIVSGFILLGAAIFLISPQNQKLTVAVPGICLLSMTAYGILQTLFFPTKILSYGWSGVLFWFTAALITITSARLFRIARFASQFRLWFIIFGTAVCVLDLLEQASHTTRYYWLIQSRYQLISGPFSYWNNFAQFVELLLPVTLWRGLAGNRPRVPYLLSAALQIGAVVASGSRAGTVLVVVELITVIGLAYERNRNKALLVGAGLAVALSLIFVYAAGFETLIYKLEQNDQLTVRRNIDRSSLAMIHMHPLAGWGLDTYVPVYRMFARYDDGTYVNRAHNDWLEWAAGGGIFFAGAMLVVVLWSIRPATRSGWGVGLIAICLHALVDYPFARFGVCAWYFCLLGMLVAFRLNQQARQQAAGRLDTSATPFDLRAAPGSL